MLRCCHWRFRPPLAAVRMLSSPQPPSQSPCSSGDFRNPLKDLCEQLSLFSRLGRMIIHQRISGGIILAPEGINGSICGTRESVEKVLAFIQRDSRLSCLRQVETPVTDS